MSDEIYQQAITAHAKSAVGAGKLPQADARFTLDNPLCGDRVTIEIKLEDGRIAAVAHEVRGCVLCRAAASVIGQRAAGLARAQIQSIDTGLRAMLGNAGDAPQTGAPLPWPELAVFRPVARHKSRHECVMLPFDALMKAFDTAAPAQTGAHDQGEP